MKHLGKGSRTQVAPQAQAAARLKSDGGRATPYVCVWEEDADARARGCITDLQCRTATRRARASAEQQTCGTNRDATPRTARRPRAAAPRRARRGPAVWVCVVVSIRPDIIEITRLLRMAVSQGTADTRTHACEASPLPKNYTQLTAHAHSHTGAAAGTRARAAPARPGGAAGRLTANSCTRTERSGRRCQPPAGRRHQSPRWRRQ